MLGEKINESERLFWFPPRGLNLTTPGDEVTPTESVKKQSSKDRFRQLLQRGLADRSVDKKILSRVMGGMF